MESSEGAGPPTGARADVGLVSLDVWATDGRRLAWAMSTQPAGTDPRPTVDGVVARVAEAYGGDGWRAVSAAELAEDWPGCEESGIALAESIDAEREVIADWLGIDRRAGSYLTTCVVRVADDRGDAPID
jgi:hypothetical protein